MATGTLGKASLVGGVETSVYSTGAGTMAIFSLNVLNMDPVATAKIRIGITTAGAPTAADYVEYDVALPPGGVLERTGMIIGPLDIIYAKSDKSNVTIRVYGYENPV